MSQWAFVFTAYAVTALATTGLIAWAYWSMRDAEGEAESLKRRK